LAAVIVLTKHPGLGAEHAVTGKTSSDVDVAAIHLQFARADFTPALGQREGVALAQHKSRNVVERADGRDTTGVSGKGPGI